MRARNFGVHGPFPVISATLSGRSIAPAPTCRRKCAHAAVSCSKNLIERMRRVPHAADACHGPDVSAYLTPEDTTAESISRLGETARQRPQRHYNIHTLFSSLVPRGVTSSSKTYSGLGCCPGELSPTSVPVILLPVVDACVGMAVRGRVGEVRVAADEPEGRS